MKRLLTIIVAMALCAGMSATAQTDQEKADEVIALIAAIPCPIDYNDACGQAIVAARDAYEALNQAQKNLVTNWAVMEAAIQLYGAEGQETYDDVAAMTIFLIDGIQQVTVSLGCENLLAAARAYYEKLLPAGKQTLVTNYSNLVDAEITLDYLKYAEPLTGSGTKEDPYVITNANQWLTFAYKDNHSYWANAKYTRLAADIETKYMVGNSDHSFNGTFDGGGHTLTLHYNTHEDFTAPFRYIESARIRNLHTAGTITGTAKFLTGLVGFVHNYSTPVIENCRVSVHIASSVAGDGTSGGFVGCVGDFYSLLADQTKVRLTDCLFDGSFSGEHTDRWGGLIAWSHYNVVLKNCLFAPTGMDVKNSENKTLARFGTNASATITNAYYTAVLGSAQGTDASAMTADELAQALGAEWYVSSETVLPYLNERSLPKSTVDGLETYYTYTGEPIEITYTVTENTYGRTLTEGTDYMVQVNGVAKDPAESLSVTEAGSYTLTFTGINAAHGTTAKTFYVFHQLDGNGTAQHPYLIHNADEWAYFAAFINAGVNADAYYRLSDDFDNTDAPVTEMVGRLDACPFSGIFDGNGKTLTVNLNRTASGIERDQQGVAPFHYIKNAAIRSLRVNGTVASDTHHTAGLVGFADGTNTIEDCIVAVTIHQRNDYAGGIVGHGMKSATTIANTCFIGAVNGVEAERANIGGLWGWNDEGSKPNLINCLENGTYTDISSMHPIGLMAGAGSLTHCFYTNPPIATPEHACTHTGYQRAYPDAPTTGTPVYQQFTLADNNDYWVAASVSMVTHYRYTGSTVTLSYHMQDAYGNEQTEGQDFSVRILDSQGDEVSKELLFPSGSYRLVFTALSPHIGSDTLTFIITEGIEVTAETDTLDNNIYVVKSNVTISERLTVTGDVYLYLNQGCTLTAGKGIELSKGNRLTIYGPGTLTATGRDARWAGDEAKPGIGATQFGTLVIHSGTVNATGGASADYKSRGSAGIGGATRNVPGGAVIINGGVVHAQGTHGGAGIGGGGNNWAGPYGVPMDTIMINGGKVYARAGELNVEHVEDGKAIGMGIPTGTSPVVPNGVLILNWTNNDDYIDANSYGGFKQVILLKSFIDTSKGVHTPEEPNLNGLKLMPYTDAPTDLEETMVNRKSSNRKFIENGLIFIERNGRIYDAQGKLVR